MSSQNQNKASHQQQNPGQKPGQQQGQQQSGGKKPGQHQDEIDPNNPQGNENTEYSGGT
jgi:hypothetical protein